jgi:hypothetical protein
MEDLLNLCPEAVVVDSAGRGLSGDESVISRSVDVQAMANRGQWIALISQLGGQRHEFD